MHRSTGQSFISRCLQPKPEPSVLDRSTCQKMTTQFELSKEGVLHWGTVNPHLGGVMNHAVLLRSALVALLRNKMRSVLTVLGITIGIAAVICVVAIGKAGQARVQQQLNDLGDNFVWIEAG